ncbi:hypothetical protein FRX31_028324 [Thalictrum thalictroides]|uniref:Uncharacterized protein n=1 Tax=Thalictrum thalictroides TaxID=46969 RepID=A0A7J6VBK9_THATH|nr:hypothetical protein FRX31_028324 [Thalictrum thalictroides]
MVNTWMSRVWLYTYQNLMKRRRSGSVWLQCHRSCVMSCCGFGNCIMLCLSSDEDDLYDVVTYDIVKDIWEFLPPCVDRHTGNTKQFVAAYPIIPDIGEKREG